MVGRLKTETWTDKATNQPRKSFKVVADQVNRVRSFGQVCAQTFCCYTLLIPAMQAFHWQQQGAAQTVQPGWTLEMSLASGCAAHHVFEDTQYQCHWMGRACWEL